MQTNPGIETICVGPYVEYIMLVVAVYSDELDKFSYFCSVLANFERLLSDDHNRFAISELSQHVLFG